MEVPPGRLDLGALHLAPGEGTRAEVDVDVEPVKIGTEDYTIGTVPVVVDVARMIGGGYSLRLRAEAGVSGTCLRCLDQITLDRTIDIREIDRPHDEDDEESPEDDDLASPYVDVDVLQLADWLRDTLVLELPATMAPPVDEADGRCELCKRTLIDLGAPEPSPSTGVDPRWAKLSELNLGEAPSEN
ncbi:MAG: YceD family protein [Solirubrobacteraceae bacterium]|nr:YceD family protein [Patulibacter sp.]